MANRRLDGAAATRGKQTRRPAKAASAVSLSRSSLAKLRGLLKNRTADSLQLAATLLESLNPSASDYAQIFTDGVIRDLVKRKRGQSVFDAFQNWDHLLNAFDMPSVVRKTLTSAIAKRLAEEPYLDFGELTSLSESAACLFAGSSARLELKGLKAISDTVALGLARHNGILDLSGLSELSGPAAASIAARKADLQLDSLVRLSDAAASALASHRGFLSLNGVVTLSDRAAQSLATHRGECLELDSLAKLTDKAAAAFAKHKGTLSLLGLTTLSDKAASALSKHKGPLFLGGLVTLSDYAADALAKNRDIELPFQFSIKRTLLAGIPAARLAYLERSAASQRKCPFLDLVAIPPGSFTMGSPPQEKARNLDETQVRVRITKPFRISKTVVTQGQWQAVMGSEPWKHHAADYAGTLTERSCGDQYPAVWITWDLASRFCSTLTELEREVGVLPATETYRLPTEAEWEYACRAGTQTAYSFGDDSEKLCDYGWFRGNSGSKLHKVALKKPNPWGLYDMHGNVWEWCADWYDTALSGGADPTGPSNDPGHDINHSVMGEMPSRVIRGGNRYCRPQLCRSAHRGGWYDRSAPSNTWGSGLSGWRLDILVGFRVVVSA